MRCPFAEWRGPLPASNYAPGPNPKIGVAHHVIQGTVSSADGEFHGQGAQLSAHFGIAGPGDPNFVDGHLVQWLDTDDDAYAQANGNYPPIAYVAIEFGGWDTTQMSPAQIQTAGRVDAWLARAHSFPLSAVDHGQAGLSTHCHYPSGQADPDWGNHSCPGMPRLEQLPAIVAAARSQGGTADMLISRDPKDGSFISVDPSGAVYTFAANGQPGGHYLGGLNNHPQWGAGQGQPEGPPVAVNHYDDGGAFSAYVIVTQDPAGHLHPYNFPSNGQYRTTTSPMLEAKRAAAGSPGAGEAPTAPQEATGADPGTASPS